MLKMNYENFDHQRDAGSWKLSDHSGSSKDHRNIYIISLLLSAQMPVAKCHQYWPE